MMEMSEIKRFYSEDLWDREQFLLREYLQYEILRIIFNSKHGLAYTFLGGTCLRICYGTDRFSEDLDFDNVGLSQADFEETGAAVQRGMELLGYKTTIKFTHKDAFHCKVSFPGMLYDYSLSGHKEAKLYIKLDTEKQGFAYERKLHRIRKFGVDADIFITPPEVLVSQKIAAVMGRKRPKGRDFYDLRWLLKNNRPDYDYLNERFGVGGPEQLRELVKERIAPFDFEQLTRDVAPFLFDEESLEMVRTFPAFWQSAAL